MITTTAHSLDNFGVEVFAARTPYRQVRLAALLNFALKLPHAKSWDYAWMYEEVLV